MHKNKFLEKLSFSIIKRIFKPIYENYIQWARPLYTDYLKDEGWLESYQKKAPVNHQGEPLPWYTYSCIHFLNSRLNDSMRVLEFGCGYSTLYFQNKVKSVSAVESDSGWLARCQSEVGENVQLVYAENCQSYCQAPQHFNLKFDIIVIDGLYRNETTQASLLHLNDSGIIIFDDTEREDYTMAYDFLAQKNFKRLDFYGLGPINTYPSQTTIFYQKNNCFNI